MTAFDAFLMLALRRAEKSRVFVMPTLSVFIITTRILILAFVSPVLSEMVTTDVTHKVYELIIPL